MKCYHKIVLSLLALLPAALGAQQTPGSVQEETMSVTGATAHLGNGEVIENAVMVFENGKIKAIGTGIPTEGEVIDASGQHLYPGFIAPAKSLGLIEINAVRASNDQDEIGEMIPHVRSIIAYNAESKVVESMRPNGVLIGQTTPQGGTISGTSSIVQFDAWNWEDAVIREDDGIHLHWPRSFRRGRWWMGEPRGFQPNSSYAEDRSKIADYLAEAKAYQQQGDEQPNQAFLAMKGLYDGKKKLYIYAQGEKEIIDAVTIAREAGVQAPVIVGGYESYKIIPFLKEHDIPVLAQETHNVPERDDDDYDLPYKLPKLLADGGILVGLQNSDASNFQTRNLPFYAGQVTGQGMDMEEALKLITGNTAKILGIDDQYGTLEEGKSATFFISEGNALDMRTNKLTHAFIDGRMVSLETHQTELYERYSEKYGHDTP